MNFGKGWKSSGTAWKGQKGMIWSGAALWAAWTVHRWCLTSDAHRFAEPELIAGGHPWLCVPSGISEGRTSLCNKGDLSAGVNCPFIPGQYDGQLVYTAQCWGLYCKKAPEALEHLEHPEPFVSVDAGFAFQEIGPSNDAPSPKTPSLAGPTSRPSQQRLT